MTYKLRNIVILIFSILFVFLAYFLAFKKTISLHSENKRLHYNIEKAKDAPSVLKQYKTNLALINNQLGYVGTKDKLSQDKILELIENFSKTNSVYLKEYSKTIVNTDNVYNLETNVIEVEGSYSKIVQLIYEIEFLKNISKVTASYFLKQRDIVTKRNRLTATIYLQNISTK